MEFTYFNKRLKLRRIANTIGVYISTSAWCDAISVVELHLGDLRGLIDPLFIIHVGFLQSGSVFAFHVHRRVAEDIDSRGEGYFARYSSAMSAWSFRQAQDAASH